MKNYKIMDKCVFGTHEMDENGRMDESQFLSDNPEGYIDSDNAVAILNALSRYKIAPVAKIAYDDGIISVYDVNMRYAIEYDSSSGWHYIGKHVFSNTVSPSALCNYVDSMIKEYNVIL